MSTLPARIEVDHVTLQLGARVVLERVALTADAGDIVAIAGPNGAGKSSLLAAIAGLRSVTNGDIRIDGTALSRLTPKQIAQRIAYVPQDRSVHWPLRVETVVALGRLPHGAASADRMSRQDEAHVTEAMTLTDTTSLSGRLVSELSGGERARVLIARALAQNADIILADESTAGLDPAHSLALFETFRHVAAQGRTVLIALHDLSSALRFCPRIVLLNNGSVAASGKTRDVLTEAEIGRVFGVSTRIGSIAGLPSVVHIDALTSFGQPASG